jgi:hypothetical protein
LLGISEVGAGKECRILALEVGKSSFNLGDILSPKMQNIVILGLEVGASPSSLGIDLGRPSGWEGGAAVGVERLESFDPVLEHLERRDPCNVRPRNFIHDLFGCVEGGRLAGHEGILHCGRAFRGNRGESQGQG